MFSELKTFFVDNPLAQHAADSIRNGREIGLVVTGGGEELGFTFTKQGGKNALLDGSPASPDIVFTIPEAAAKELISKNFSSVGQVGLHIFEKILSNDPNQKIHVKLHAGVLSLVTGGYLGVLTAGGGEVAKFMASKGLGNMGKIKDAISRMRK